MPENDKGYYKKYTVIDNRTGQEVEEPTFTLVPSRDEDAATALRFYAELIAEKNPTLYNDLLDLTAVPA